MTAFDPFCPDFRDDPYPEYARLRAAAAVHWSDAVQAFVLPRYEQVSQLLRDPRFSAVRSTEPPGLAAASGPLTRRVSREILLVRDPPDHTRLRALVSQVFSKARAEKLRERAGTLARALLAELPDAGEFDLLPAFATPLPLAVIAELLGVDAGGMPAFRRWAQELAALMDPARFADESARASAESALVEAQAYFGALFAERASQPADDLVSALVAASAHEDRLSRDELFAMCVLILVAGHETTAHLVGIAAHALLARPELRAALRDEPALIPGAVEELLRFETVAQFTGRVAAEELEIGGCRVPRGATVLGLLASANRDAAVFPEPDRLDIRRSPNPHLAFGVGRHFCLGASLARMEAAEAIAALVAYPRALRLADAAPRWRSSTLRGLEELRVA